MAAGGTTMKRQGIPAGAMMVHAMLLMMVMGASPSSGFIHPAIPSRIIVKSHHAPTFSRIFHPRRPATTMRDGAIDDTAEPPTEAPGFPGTIFPQGVTSSLTKAPPKKSLSDLPTPQDATAATWILNLIELIHWVSFPLGFFVASFVFENAPSFATVLGGDTQRVFFIVLGLMCQVFGGGISGNMMHLYEGWQVTPFRNPLESSPPGQKFPVSEFNNAWRRSVAYQMLFTFQNLGLGLFTTGVFGVNNWTTLLVAGSTAIALLGPKEPRLGFTRLVDGEQRPVLPLSLSLTVVFGINVIANLAANVQLFSGSLKVSVPFFIGDAAIPACIVSIVPTLLIAVGGAIEGYVAETSFNQWDHFIAFVTLLAGLAANLLLYENLLTFIPSE